MRHFDLTPLYRSTIGFDRLGSLLDTLGAFEGDAPSSRLTTSSASAKTSIASEWQSPVSARRT